jgi:transcriptional regulator with XRE-family HTH domain
MDYYSMTDQGVAREIGGRVRSLRLRRNRTQQQVSEATALSLNAIKALESGKAKLTTLIAVLRELGSLDELDCLIPEITISPLQMARRKGKQRQRASGKRLLRRSKDDGAW